MALVQLQIILPLCGIMTRIISIKRLQPSWSAEGLCAADERRGNAYHRSLLPSHRRIVPERWFRLGNRGSFQF